MSIFNRQRRDKASAPPVEPTPDSSSYTGNEPETAPVPPSMPDPSALTPHMFAPDRSASPDEFSLVDANISDTDYARRCKELMTLHNELSNLGAGDLLDLPRIVVIGGQSAGKSSLVEAVSGINVPRDSGTCTRCPMECYMSTSSGSWSCDISLRFDYDSSGIRLSASRTEAFGPRLTNKSDMDIWLRRAQAAILSPHLPFQNFISKSVEDIRSTMKLDNRVLKFSKNAVCIDIKDPDATVLSFVDLPGLIQNEVPEMIKLVREMVVDKIGGEKSENTLILITIPMSDDMENQQAVRLAREADQGGIRTIGVLTKPDTLTQGATSARLKWKDVIQGQSHSLRHGYYCVRLLDDEERARKMSRFDAQKLETDFFASTAPWNSLLEQKRYGIPAFVNDISRLLTDMIEKNLPKLKEDVVKLLGDCQSELDKQPVPIANEPSAEILLRVTKFCNDLNAAVYGDRFKHFAQENRDRYTQFKLDILDTEPDFRPSYIFAPANGRDHPDKIYGLMDIRDVIKRSIAWELPDHVPFDATKFLILEFTSRWRDPSIDCFNSVFSHLSVLVDRLISMHFGQFKQLQSYMSSLVANEISNAKKETLRTLHKVLALEQVPAFTQNHEDLEFEGKRWLGIHSDVRRSSTVNGSDWADHVEARPISPVEEKTEHVDFIPQASAKKKKKSRMVSRTEPIIPDYNQQEAIRSLINAGYGTFTAEDLSRLLVPSEYREELAVMAKVTAYFKVAFKRVIDYIPLTIEHELNQSFTTNLQEVLFQTLLKDPDVVDHMKELLSEDPAIVRKRDFLEGRANRLKEIQQKLENFRRDSVAT